MTRPPPAPEQAATACEMASVESFLPSPSAPYLVISKSRLGNTGALMRARMELASSAAASLDRAAAAAAEIRKARRFSISVGVRFDRKRHKFIFAGVGGARARFARNLQIVT